MPSVKSSSGVVIMGPMVGFANPKSKEYVDEDMVGRKSLDIAVVPSGFIHAGGRLDVSDLLRLRVREGALRSDVSEKLIMLLR